MRLQLRKKFIKSRNRNSIRPKRNNAHWK